MRISDWSSDVCSSDLDENDRLALVLAMSTPDCGLTAAAIDMFVDMARDKGISLAQTLREAMTSGRATAGGPLERFMTKFDAVKNVRLTEPRAFEAIAETVGLDQAAVGRAACRERVGT